MSKYEIVVNGIYGSMPKDMVGGMELYGTPSLVGVKSVGESLGICGNRRTMVRFECNYKEYILEAGVFKQRYPLYYKEGLDENPAFAFKPNKPIDKGVKKPEPDMNLEVSKEFISKVTGKELFSWEEHMIKSLTLNRYEVVDTTKVGCEKEVKRLLNGGYRYVRSIPCGREIYGLAIFELKKS